jgi:hypothetical protein
MQVLRNRGLASRSAAEVPHLLAVSRRAEAAGDGVASSLAFMAALSLSTWFGTPEMRSALRGQASPHLEAQKSWTWWPKAAEMASAGLFEAAVKDGLWDEAERLAPGFESWQHEANIFGSMWHACMGDFAFARGDYSEALSHYEQVIAHARLWNNRPREALFVPRLEEAERAQTRARRRSKTVKAAQPAAGGSAALPERPPGPSRKRGGGSRRG